MAVPATNTVSAMVSKRMGDTVGRPVLPFQRHRRVSPYARLAEELGYAREKTARDNVAVAYKRVALTNRVLIEAGLTGKVGELMAVVEASLMGECPPLNDAIYRADCADAMEDRYEADFIRNSGDTALAAWIKHLAQEIHNSEVLLKALITERDKRRSEAP